jgi:GNAT superfamily N-acetyltransferase
MHIHSTDSVDEYAAAVMPFLEDEACARNVLLSVIESVRIASAAYSAPPSFWWVDDSGTVVGAASWTPPYQILVSSLPLEAAPALAAAMIERASALGIDPAGINGPEVAAGAVAAAFAAASGDVIKRERPILLNELAHLVDVPKPTGECRKATLDDVPMIADWVQAFGAELDLVVGADPRATAERSVLAGGFDLWIDGGIPVCLVGHRLASGVVRVGPVYTPPEQRNRGYGRRLTYEVTAAALARPDVTRAVLFTDADNPVSNAIYRQAGYEPRGRHVEVEFAERPAHSGR